MRREFIYRLWDVLVSFNVAVSLDEFCMVRLRIMDTGEISHGVVVLEVGFLCFSIWLWYWVIGDV